MRFFTFLTVAFLFAFQLNSQTTTSYDISFENAVHHEALVKISLKELNEGPLRLRMSRSSPGRYAVHEFAKNVYNLKASDEDGKALQVKRTAPNEWSVENHKGTVIVSYILFANHGDGTYAQIDETHAHLNVPATFIYPPDYSNRPVELKINAREDLNWKTATQLKLQEDGLYFAPDLYYFMDSPIEVSNHRVKSFTIGSGDDESTIRFALHQENGYDDFDSYFDQVKSVVTEQIKIFGTLPKFDFDTYTFLACYAPNVDGDGMEHRNSTVVTSVRSLSKGGLQRNIGTVAHEFFHAWNVERIRPASLEPFNFEDANMSGELWFAEGFTSYYTNLSLCRAGIMTHETYVERLSDVLSYVINSPGHNYFNPIEMSYQAPFVDAATSVDQVNRENTYISYYSYGNVLGLALDLSLRRLDTGKNLDGFMKLVWQTHGVEEIPYSIGDLESLLTTYSSKDFSQQFFSRYIYHSDMPDFKSILADFGISLKKANPGLARLGAFIEVRDNKWLVTSNPTQGSALYKAGMSKGDLIISLGSTLTDGKKKTSDLLKMFSPGQTVKLKYLRYGQAKETELTFGESETLKTSLLKEADSKSDKRRKEWLTGTNK